MIVVPQNAETFADVSFYQRGMQWEKYPWRATILRIGQGEWKDKAFDEFYQACQERGIIVGGYWFYDDRIPPKYQADVILDALSGKNLQMELFIDYERVYGGIFHGLPNIKSLIEILEKKIKNEIGIYTGYYFWTQNTSKDKALYPFFAKRPLWLAWYEKPEHVHIPEPWTTWTHWQYGTPAVDWGQPTKEIDANVYNGTRDEFAARYGAPQQNQQPGGNMLKGSLKSGTSSLKIRSGPSTAYPQIDGIYTGDVVFGTLDAASNWLHVSKIVRANGTTQAIDGWCSAAFLNLSQADDAGEITVSITLKPDGSVTGSWTRH
jgi:GH25 family lysozyme M1 (1,4-beta-N-acetylmuramidase)